MTLDASRPDLNLGIVGAGIMGRGIAQVAAEAGLDVRLADARRETADEAVAFAADMLRRKVARGKMPSADAEAAIGRLRAVDAGPEAGYGALAGCHVVVEAVVERMDVKHAVLAGLEDAVAGDCLIATNTSSLSVTGFAAGARRPERIGGFHFFNPVPLMRLVEVIAGVLTADWVPDALVGLARRLGHHPVRTADTPGFLVNHAGRAYGTEALRIVGEGVCGVADIDRIMTQAAGFRMGPFQLLDLTGLDVSHTVMESIYHQFYEEPRFRPSVITAQRQAAGLYGRKTGRGFYDYADGQAAMPPEPALPAPGTLPVWVSPRHPAEADRVRAVLAGAGARLDDGARPGADAVCVVTPYGADATTTALDEDLDPARVVAVDPLLDLAGRRTVMGTPVTRRGCIDHVRALLGADGTPVTAINDSPGFVAQRIVACIVNVGADIAQQRIAAPDDINTAVTLGLGYPRGSLRFGDDLGPGRILAILEAMLAVTGDPRYRPSPWLRRRALLGVPLTTPDGAP
jgi:3-hydroxybutyryl-CoA dehydrogenase